MMRRVLIVHCSHSKKAVENAKAIDMYDGPTFKIIRHFLEEAPAELIDVDVYILSALYGLIKSDQDIEYYDFRMTLDRAKELRKEVLIRLDQIFKNGYSEICIALSKNYMQVIEGYLSRIPQEVRVTEIRSSQGKRLKRLKGWLYKEEISEKKGGKDSEPIYKFTGRAIIKGKKVSFTREEIYKIAAEALKNDIGEFGNFRNWYSLIDGRRVSTKWLVSLLSGIPVKEFQASDARRVLGQLGIEVFFYE